MGAYKNFRKQINAIQKKHQDTDYGLLEAGVEVVKASRKNGQVDFKTLKKKPEKFSGIFIESFDNYVKTRLCIDDELWKKTGNNVREQLRKSFGVTDSLVKYTIGAVAGTGKLTQLGEVISKADQFRYYNETKQQDMIETQADFADKYRKSREKINVEILKEHGMEDIVDPRALDLKTALEAIPEYARYPKSDLEKILRESAPHLLKSNYL